MIDTLLAKPWALAEKLESVRHTSPGTFKPGTAIRIALQDTGDLVGQQDDQQDARHYEPGRHDFAQNVAPENIPQPTSLQLHSPA